MTGIRGTNKLLDEIKNLNPIHIHAHPGNQDFVINEIRPIDKFGYNGAVGTGAQEDVWAAGGTKSYLTSAETMDVVSSDAADDLGSTGAEKITIEGLDSNWNEVSETITMDGVTPVTGTQTFIRVNRAYCTQVGSGGVNAGNITISATSAGHTESYIPLNEGQSLQAIYSVPANYDFYITGFYFNNAKGDDSIIRIYKRETTNGTHDSWRVQRILANFQSHIRINLSAWIKTNEKSDVRMTAIAGNATNVCAGGFDGYLVRTD